MPSGRSSFRLAALGVALAALCTLVPDVARAQEQPPGVYLGLTKYTRGQKTPIMVLPVRGAAGDSIGEMIARDLDFSDRFTIIKAAGPLDTSTPNYPLFARLGAAGVVQGTVLPTGYLRVQLHDVATQKVVNSKDFALPASTLTPAWRFAVHQVSDGIEEWITSQRGIASTRIAFERGGRIWTVDSDGAGLRAVTENGMSAAWTPSGRHLVYNVLDGARNPIMAVDLATGAKRVVTSASNTQDITPVVSADGRTVAFARITENGTDIHVVPFEGGTPRRVTVGRGRISSQPSFSPDGGRIVFCSDRPGHPEVYISDVDGTNAEQLTSGSYGDRENRAAPDWSPDGRLVVYESLNGGAYQLMTLNVRDNSTRQVTSESRNQDPSWAPDSRHIVFTSHRSGNRQLWVVDIETGRTRQLTRGAEARLAAWSPRLAAP